MLIVHRRLAEKLSLAFQVATRNYKDRAKASVKPGAYLVIDGSPHRVTSSIRMTRIKYTFLTYRLGIIQGKRGKGSGFIKAKLKSLANGTSFERTFISDDIVEHAELETEAASYSWEEADNLVFINSTTFEELRIPKSEVENFKFIQEGQDVKLQKFNDKIIGMKS